MSRWDGIYEFVQVVDCGSFTAAGGQMGISTSQVSKRIARLEERLRTRLLQRTTRRLTLTDDGLQFYRRCRQAVDTFERAEEDITQRRTEPRGNLRVNITGGFQERLIVPILARFCMKYSRLNLQTDFTEQRPDLIANRYDLSIGHGELRDTRVVARKLIDSYPCLVTSREYLDRHGTPACVEELSEHNCLVGTERTWYLSDGRDTVQLQPEGNWRSDNHAALVNAARCGLGIALLPFLSVLEDIESGQLVQLLPEWNRHPQPLWLMYPKQRHLPIKVRLFVDYLAAELPKAMQ